MKPKKPPKPNNPKLIRLVKHTGDHWPYFTHPDYPDHELDLRGAFHVAWSKDDVTVTEISTKNVSTMSIRGSKKISGVFLYFERRLNNMDVMYEPHEVELHDHEVLGCLVNPNIACLSA